MKTAMQELIDTFNEYQEIWNLPIYAILEAELMLEKEKEQIIDAYADGLNAHRTNFCNREEYYTQTYNQNK